MLSVVPNQYMFIEKYRPQTIEECILPSADKEVFLELIAKIKEKKKRLPHLILHSNSPGTGKTTVAKALCYDIDAEYMFVNGSGCGIEFIKNEITRFATSLSVEGRQKVVILDEFDRKQLIEAQRYLRSFMENTSSNCTFIITANNLDGIITHLRSRMQVIKFGIPTRDDTISMMKEMIVRCIEICKNEDIQVSEPKVLAALVKKNFPDFRKTVGLLDHYGTSGVIDKGILSVVMEERSSIDDVITAFKERNFGSLVKLAPKYAPDYANFIDKLIKELYDHIDDKSKITLYEIAGENNQYHGLAANVELHLILLFVQIFKNITWK